MGRLAGKDTTQTKKRRPLLTRIKSRLTPPPPPSPLERYEARLSEDLRPPFSELDLAGLALQVTIDILKPRRAIDVGCGAGRHARLLREAGCDVLAVDFGRSVYYGRREDGTDIAIGDFLELDLPGDMDLVWISHVLEHQPDVNRFLRRARACLAQDGWAVVTVPPAKPQIVGGHLTHWSPGLLLYNLVLAGFDGASARLLRHGYNITAFCRPHSDPLPELDYDSGDIDRLTDRFPPGCMEGFDGAMTEYLWTPPGYGLGGGRISSQDSR
ncbi:MAG: class I SAM-dependent methyltransferase [Pseudomonadota bacterium]